MSELVKKQNTEVALSWDTPENRDLIKNTLTKDFTDNEFSIYWAMCISRKLNPITKQIYGFKSGGKVVMCVGIDGFRSLADRTGKHMGTSLPIYDFEADGSTVKSCTVIVKKLVSGHIVDFPAIIFRKEFVSSNPNWQTKLMHMMGVRAESHAHRKAFPEQLGGVYMPDEIEPDIEPQAKGKKTFDAKAEKEKIVEKSEAEKLAELDKILPEGVRCAQAGDKQGMINWLESLTPEQKILVTPKKEVLAKIYNENEHKNVSEKVAFANKDAMKSFDDDLEGVDMETGEVL